MLTPLVTTAQETYTVRFPDVKNEYCGVEINYQYCKCAFHNDYCNAVNHTQNSAYNYVMGQYRTWVSDKIESAARSCLEDGNQWSAGSRTCTIRPDAEPQATAPKESLSEAHNLPTMVGVPEPVTSGYYGKITESNGDVFVYQWAFKRWVRAIPGMPIYQGDFITTREGQSKIIYNGDRGDEVMRLSSGAILETGRSVRPEPRAENTTLLGIIREGTVETYNALQEAVTEEAPTPEWYNQLHTPTAVLGIRGTHFITSVDGASGETTVTLIEGVVDVVGDTASTTLTAGESVVLSSPELATSTVDTSAFLADSGFPTRTDATAEELVHDAPTTPVDTEPAPEVEPTREELIGDTSDIDAMMPRAGGFPWWLILLIALGAGGGWLYRRRKNTA